MFSAGYQHTAWIARVLLATEHGQSETVQEETSREGATSRACRPGRCLIAATTTTAAGSQRSLAGWT